MDKKRLLYSVILGVIICSLGLFLSQSFHRAPKPINPSASKALMAQATTLRDTTADQKEVWLTIFVHGTFSYLLRKMDFSTIASIAQDKIEGTFYQKATGYMRQNPFFRTAQPMQGLGLQAIDKTTVMPGKAATALANIFDQVDVWNRGRVRESNLYYTFGWDGIVSPTLRLKNAQTFYDQLLCEVQQLQALGLHPKIRIFTFSHGGNVTLLLSKIHATKAIHERLLINELILLGCTVHADMYEQVTSPLFQHIYNVHSPADRAQTLDLTTLGSFSQRVFIAPKNGTLPDSLTQIEFNITRDRKTKKQWEPAQDPRRDFEKPSILHGNSSLLRRSSPGHTELWFFKWVDSNYRENFPLAPLPTLAIMPLILDAIRKGVSPNEKNLIVDVRPDQNVFIIKSKTGHTIGNLLTLQQFDELKSIAKAYEPLTHSHSDYDEQGDMAILRAQQELRAHHLAS